MQTKSILGNSLLSLLAFSVICITGCTEKKDYATLQFTDFTSELSVIGTANTLTASEFQALKKKHGRFFDLWFNEIMDLGMYYPGNDSAQAVVLHEFCMRNKPVFRAIAAHYKKYPRSIQEISNAFGQLNDVLGDVRKPLIYSYFSQFSNYNTFIDTSNGKTVLAFSSEMFMNDTFPLYKLLEVPEFFNRYNHTEQLPAMLVWNYLKGRFESEQAPQNMLDEAVFNGKIWYTMESIFGRDNIWKTFGYTEAEWRQMITEEGQIWRHYLNEKMLFNSNFNQYKRYFTYGNHTFGGGIPPDCPPLIGNFTGYRIVSAYMQKHKKDLKQLWKLKDASLILQQSSYNPIK